MAQEFEYSSKENSTSLEVNDFKVFTEAIFDYSTIICTLIGLTDADDSILIYLVARNTRMYTKTNLVLLNFAVNDAFLLCTNINLINAIDNIFKSGFEYVDLLRFCVLTPLPLCCQQTAAIFLLVLISNRLMKNKRATVSAIAIVNYVCNLINYLTSVSMCYTHHIWFMNHLGLLFFSFAYLLLLVKEFNCCFKKWYRKDPLSESTQFRINVARIYLYAWLVLIPLHRLTHITELRVFAIAVTALTKHSLMTGAYILAFVCSADKQFRSLIHCRDASMHDVDATITFAEESNNGEHVSIRFEQTNVPSQN